MPMSYPSTHLSVLAALRDPGVRDEGWDRFYRLYAGPIRAWCLAKGIPPADVDDVAQDAMTRTWRGVSGYDPKRGPFHSWLAKVVLSAIADHYRKRRPEGPNAAAPGGTTNQDFIDSLQDPGSVDDLTTSIERHLSPGLRDALGRVEARVEERTWRAFSLLHEAGLTAREVADKLGMTVGAVYTADYRVRQLIREELESPAR
jgi:RNA polymerase sigma factor (sigma-70 family)